jgi:putative alpha-1,2-mannosidase
MTRSRRLSRTLLVATGTAVACLLPTIDAVAAPAGYVADPAATVNPFLGTSNAFDDFPGADVPFGMVQWSPDTPSRPAGGGYEYNDKTITGFSLDHVSGPGCSALGDVPILPTVGAIGAKPGSATEPLDHTQEQATPGYYALTAGGVKSGSPSRPAPRRTCCSSCPTAPRAPTPRTSRSSTTTRSPAGSPAATSAAPTTSTPSTST